MRNLGDAAGGTSNADRHIATETPSAANARILAYADAARRRHSTESSDEPAPTQEAVRDATRPGPRSLPAENSSVLKAKASAASEAAARVSREILRFRTSERALHWSIAVPFMVCLATGIVLKLFFNHLHPQFSAHTVLQWVHRVSGACLLLLPVWTALRHRKDLALYRYNVKRAWSWTLGDIKWLALIGPASVSRRVKLPEQHKFNAGEKLNFMSLTLTYPLLVVTGLLLLTPGIHFISWIGHVAVAILSAPLIFGHIYLAVVNPDTRVGLSGMFTGHVDREWARHHYAKWYRETFGEDQEPKPVRREAKAAPPARAMIRCLSCGAESPLTSWATVLESVSELRPLRCLACSAPSAVVSAVVKVEDIGAILEGLEHAGVSGPRRDGPRGEYLAPTSVPVDEAGAGLSPYPDGA